MVKFLLSVVCRLAIAGVLRILNEKRVYNSCFIYIGKQNYFVNLRNGLGQSTYDQIITYFLGQSSVYIDSMNLSEWHIYGSSRLGIYQTSINMAYRNIRIVNSVTTQETSTTVTLPSYTLFAVERGSKRYELTNHLGNVLAVVSDKKIQVCTSTAISYYTADLVSATDYSPFGVPLEGRSYTAPNISYRFGGAGGQEKDDEIFKGAYTAEYWEYDSRLGRRWNVDPITYPWQSSYAVFNNCPTSFVDPNGLEGVNPPGAPQNPSPGDKYKHKDDNGTEWEYEYKEGGWQGNGGTSTKPLKDVIIKSNGAGKPNYSYQDWYNKYKKPELERQLEKFRQSIYKNTAYFPSTSGELHSIGVGFTPLGIGADFYTLMTGKDAFTGENICGIWRYIGIIPLVSELRKGKKIISIADEVIEVGDETFYRSMSSESAEIFLNTGRMPAGTETFVSPTKSFAQNYNGTLFEISLKSGTVSQLSEIGVRNAAAGHPFGYLPLVAKGWKSTNAFFKFEGKNALGMPHVNIGLGNGRALDIFNLNIKSFKIIN